MEIWQLIQLPSFFMRNLAADSTAKFFFHSGGAAWGRSAQAPGMKTHKKHLATSCLIGFGSGFGTNFCELKYSTKVSDNFFVTKLNIIIGC